MLEQLLIKNSATITITAEPEDAKNIAQVLRPYLQPYLLDEEYSQPATSSQTCRLRFILDPPTL